MSVCLSGHSNCAFSSSRTPRVLCPLRQLARPLRCSRPQARAFSFVHRCRNRDWRDGGSDTHTNVVTWLGRSFPQGVNLSTSEAAGALRRIDCFTSTPTTLVDLFDAIAAVATADSTRNSNVEPAPVSVVIDDLSALKWEFGADQVLAFARCCKTLTHARNGHANVVVRSHADTETASLSPLKPMVR